MHLIVSLCPLRGIIALSAVVHINPRRETTEPHSSFKKPFTNVQYRSEV